MPSTRHSRVHDLLSLLSRSRPCTSSTPPFPSECSSTTWPWTGGAQCRHVRKSGFSQCGWPGGCKKSVGSPNRKPPREKDAQPATKHDVTRSIPSTCAKCGYHASSSDHTKVDSLISATLFIKPTRKARQGRVLHNRRPTDDRNTRQRAHKGLGNLERRARVDDDAGEP